MDFNEIVDWGLKVEAGLFFGGAAYLAMMFGGSGILGLFSERINSEEDLKRVSSEEYENLGLNQQISYEFHEYHRFGHVDHVKKLEDGTYKVHIEGGSTRGIVRHELYHVYKDHCGDSIRINDKSELLNVLDSLFRREPQAIAYEHFGWKI